MGKDDRISAILIGQAKRDNQRTKMSDQKPETIALHGGQEPGPDHQRPRGADLPDDLLHLQRHGPRREPVRPAEPGNIYTRIMNPTWDVLEQRVAAARGRNRRGGPGLRAGGSHLSVLNICQGRRQHRLRPAALRRHLQPVRPHPAPVRHRGPVRRRGRPGSGRPAGRRATPASSSVRRSATRAST